MMSECLLPDELESGETARLIPVASSRQKESHAISALLGVFRMIPDYAAMMLAEVEAPVNTRSRLEAYTEVCFKTKAKVPSKSSTLPRPDGYIVVESRGKRWAALIEAKVKNDELKSDQIEKYLDLARDVGADAVITISNDFALLPTHHPVRVNRQKTRNTGLYHFSWLSLLSNAQILADSDELKVKEQAFVLRELIRFLDDERSGVQPFDRMGSGWKEICNAVQHGQQLTKTSDLVAEAVADWHQLTRFLALELSPHLGEPINVYVRRAHRRDPAKRLDADINDLVKFQAFDDEFDIPNAASRIHLTADLRCRTITLSMELNPPEDKKRPTAAINWLTRQLDPEKAKHVLIRADWPGRIPPTMEPLSVCLEYPNVLVPDNVSDLPTKLGVRRVYDLAGRFRGARTLVEDLTKAFAEFYKNVGQNLHPWTPPPPKYRKPRDEESRKVEHEETSTIADEKTVEHLHQTARVSDTPSEHDGHERPAVQTESRKVEQEEDSTKAGEKTVKHPDHTARVSDTPNEHDAPERPAVQTEQLHARAGDARRNSSRFLPDAKPLGRPFGHIALSYLFPPTLSG
jgi:hypothetical protein